MMSLFREYARVVRIWPIVMVMLAAALPAMSHAQQSLVGFRTTTAGPIYETWTFGNGVSQRVGGDRVLVSRVTQWSIPLVLVVPLGNRFTLDVAGAYTSGEVELESEDAALQTDRYQLTGPTDVRVRLVTRLAGDNILFTIGVNAPAGKTSLERDELAALRVLASPALRLQTPALGSGAGGTAGLVIARQLANWALALGASYEVRGTYSPIAALAAGAPSPDFDPGDVIHLSLGLDGFVGQHGMTLALTADRYSEDEFKVSGSLGPNESTVVQLGPSVSAEWQVRFAANGWRELTLYAVDRYRTKYKQGGATVTGTDGNQLDGGLRGVLVLSRSVGLLMGIDGRHHTGLKVDNSLATAAYAGGGATLGLSLDMGGLVLQPFARGQMGSVDTGGEKTDARGLAGGVTLGMKF